jgi:ribosomal protein L20
VQVAGVDPVLAYSNWLDDLKSTQTALRRLVSDLAIADEPELGTATTNRLRQRVVAAAPGLAG